MTTTYKCALCREINEMPVVVANRYGTLRDWENKICNSCYEKRLKAIIKLKSSVNQQNKYNPKRKRVIRLNLKPITKHRKRKNAKN